MIGACGLRSIVHDGASRHRRASSATAFSAVPRRSSSSWTRGRPLAVSSSPVGRRLSRVVSLCWASVAAACSAVPVLVVDSWNAARGLVVVVGHSMVVDGVSLHRREGLLLPSILRLSRRCGRMGEPLEMRAGRERRE